MQGRGPAGTGLKNCRRKRRHLKNIHGLWCLNEPHFYPQLSVSSVSSSSRCLSPIMGWCPLPVWRTCVDPLCPGWTNTAPCLRSDPVSPVQPVPQLTSKPRFLQQQRYHSSSFRHYMYLCLSFPSVVLSSLRLLSTTTAILTDPSVLPEQATLAVTQGNPTAVLDQSLQPATRDNTHPMWPWRADSVDTWTGDNKSEESMWTD